MYSTKLSSTAATDLFTAVKENNKLKELYIDNNAITNKLKELYIDNNAITDDACGAITERNSCLVKLGMYGNPLSSEAIVNIVRCPV